MSSTYRAICLSHTPALVVEEPDWQQMDEALAGLAAGIPGHPSCELVLGRFSYPLIEVCCPRQTARSKDHGAFHPHTDEWVEAAWLRLMLLAGPEAVKTARVRGCWTYERARRLAGELLDEPTDVAPPLPIVVWPMPDISAKAVYEKYAALPPRDRATARWVMSRATLEALCAAVSQPKPPWDASAARLIGLPVEFDETAVGMEVRT